MGPGPGSSLRSGVYWSSLCPKWIHADLRTERRQASEFVRPTGQILDADHLSTMSRDSVCVVGGICYMAPRSVPCQPWRLLLRLSCHGVHVRVHGTSLAVVGASMSHSSDHPTYHCCHGNHSMARGNSSPAPQDPVSSVAGYSHCDPNSSSILHLLPPTRALLLLLPGGPPLCLREEVPAAALRGGGLCGVRD